MHRFVTFLACFFVINDASGGSEMKSVKVGDAYTLRFKAQENINRLTIEHDGEKIFERCSQEEQSRGCKEINLRNVSLQYYEGLYNLTFPEAHDGVEGTYEVKAVDDQGNMSQTTYNIKLNETVTDDDGATHTVDLRQGTASTTWSKTVTTLIVVVVIIGIVAGFYIFICHNRKKKKENRENLEALDWDCEQGISLRSDENRGEPNAE